MTSCILRFILNFIFTLSGIYNMYITIGMARANFTPRTILWTTINCFFAIIVFKFFIDSYKDLLYNVKQYKKRKNRIDNIQSLIK